MFDDLALLTKCQLCGLTGHSARRCPNFTHSPVSQGVKRRRMVNLSLPEVIIQRIQSFLGGREAAQTCILSKSWYSAWLTRPDLDFDERDFPSKSRNQKDEEFWDFAKKTLQRYEELNLNKIESFKLLMIDSSSMIVNRVNYLREELIAKAMKMGVVDLDLGIVVYRQPASRTYTLPRVVLESETLIRLSVTMIDLENGKVSWSRLRSLSLHRVSFGDDNIISDIISSCPLIEELTLSRCRQSEGRLIRLVVDGPCNLSCLYKLKSLFLVEVDVDPLYFSGVLSKFPCLKYLSLQNCGGYNDKEIKLSSRSLECITFKQKELLRANFDIPSTIRKFEYSGWHCPTVFFTTVSSNLESRISIKHPRTEWFLKLQKLLTSLRLSKIFLSLTLSSIQKNLAIFQGSPRTAVEDLTIYASYFSTRSTCMERLFQICRPKLITLHLLPRDLFGWKRGVMQKSSVKEVQKMCLMENKNMFGLHDLEEVNVQLFEGYFAEWWPLSHHQTMVGDSREEKLPKIRFQLRWAEDPVSLK